jgi:hypothetical protein
MSYLILDSCWNVLTFVPSLCINNIITPVTNYIFYRHSPTSCTTMTLSSSSSLSTRLIKYNTACSIGITSCTYLTAAPIVTSGIMTILHSGYMPIVVKYSIYGMRSILQFYTFVLGSDVVPYVLTNCIYCLGTFVKITNYAVPRISCGIGISL